MLALATLKHLCSAYQDSDRIRKLSAADQRDAEAQYTLGVMNAHGNGVAKDDTEAVKWYRKAADQGYAKA